MEGLGNGRCAPSPLFPPPRVHGFGWGVDGVGDGGAVAPEEGEAGPDLSNSGGRQNSLMVTVRRLVVTSVTTTSAQHGAISGCQSGSPSRTALGGSGERRGGLLSGSGDEAPAAGALLGRRLRCGRPLGRRLVIRGAERSTAASSSSSDEDGEEDGEGQEGR